MIIVDYLRTLKDAYALPRVEDIFDCLYGSKWFSTIDMKSGYHQVEMEEDHKPLTAFTLGPLGFGNLTNFVWFGKFSGHVSTYYRRMFRVFKYENMYIVPGRPYYC